MKITGLLYYQSVFMLSVHGLFTFTNHDSAHELHVQYNGRSGGKVGRWIQSKEQMCHISSSVKLDWTGLYLIVKSITTEYSSMNIIK